MSDATYETRLAPPMRDRRGGVLGFYDASVQAAVNLLDGWFTGLVARFAIFSVVGLYYMGSAWGSLNGSLLNLFSIDDGAYVAMLPSVMERYEYDASAMPFVYDVFVWAGVLAELLLPLLILVGLFTRIAVVGLIVVVAVQSYVDVALHGLDDASVGAAFDAVPGAIIWDQRLLWVALLAILALRGPGLISVDALLRRGSTV